MSILSIDLHSSKSTIRLSFHFQNVTYESLDDIYCSKFSTGCNPSRTWMTASALRLIPLVRRRMSWCDSCCHSRCNALLTDEWLAQEVPNMSQICFMGFNSGLMAGQGTEVTASLLEVGGYWS
jgi:hypothetical protein